MQKKSEKIKSCLSFLDSSVRIGREVLPKDIVFDLLDETEMILGIYKKAVKEEMEEGEE